MAIGTAPTNAPLAAAELAKDWDYETADSKTASLTGTYVDVPDCTMTTASAGDFIIIGVWNWQASSDMSHQFLGRILVNGAEVESCPGRPQSNLEYPYFTTTGHAVALGVGAGEVIKLQAKNNVGSGGFVRSHGSRIVVARW